MLHPWGRLDLEDLLDLEDQGQWMLHLSDPSGQSAPADQWGQQRLSHLWHPWHQLGRSY